VSGKVEGTLEGNANMKVLNVGSLNVDYVYEVDHLIRPEETMAVRSRSVFAGGKGLNQSVALKNAGADVYHAGIIGSDGGTLLQTLEEYGINSRFVERAGVPGGHAVIQVDKNGGKCILYFCGTNRMLNEGFIANALSFFDEEDWVVLQNETNGIALIIEAAHSRGMRVVFNPTPCDKSIISLPLRLVDYLVINRVEGEAISGTPNESKMIETIAEKYPGMKIALTLGGDGSCYFDGERTYYQPALSKTIKDTTAAGDAYLGYFVHGVMQNHPPEEILLRATKAAAITVSRLGAAQSIPFAWEVDK